MRLTPVVLLVLTAVTTGQGLPSQDPPIQRLIQQMASDDYAERDAATKALAKLGEPALEALREAAKSKDAETRRRATTVIEAITERLYQDALDLLKARGGEITVPRYPGDDKRVVILSDKVLRDSDLAKLAWLKDVKKLILSHAEVSAQGFSGIKNMSRIDFLDLSDAKIPAEALCHLRGLAKLRCLDLSGTAVTDASLGYLERLPLSSLRLRGTAVGDAGIERLQGHDQLQLLDLSDTRVGDAGLSNLKGLPELRSLYLCNTRVTNAGLARLRRSTDITMLDLSGTRVTDAGLAHVKGWGLGTLILANTRVTDDGLVHLRGVGYLDLSRTRVTDAAVAHLQRFDSLQTLILTDTKVTEKGIAALKSALPHIAITR
jgi:hypothetical protein